MDIIHLLPDSVANQIAAGEVIQRPASCLKELVENALDAGAKSILVLLYDAGRTMMQVIDDGKGMSETDARMAFERHATSKIQSAQDLFALRTMGFRGEALASICAVAQVELTTRREEDEMGTRLEIHGSDVITQEPCQCPVGANFKVKNLFYNVPARRRFLKTDATELRHIITEFYHIVLVNPQCQFTLTNNDAVLMELPACSFKQRIEQVFGKSTNRQFTAGLVDIKSDTELVSIRGYVGKPEFASKNAQQFFFVNNRFMRHPYFHKAVMTAFSGMLTQDVSPSYFIYFDINPEQIDVNIHPTKTEIKFADEQAIWQILLATVKEALGKFHAAPVIDFDVEDKPEIPVVTANVTDIVRPEIQFDPTYNPFSQPTNYTPEWSQDRQGASRTSYADHRSYAADPHSYAADHRSYADHSYPTSNTVTGWNQLYDGTTQDELIATAQCRVAEHNEADDVLFEDELSNLMPYQYAGKYILLPTQGGLLVIDQHRAHCTVLFAQVLQMLNNRRGVSQSLLFPEIVDFSSDDMLLMQQIEEQLRYVGFEVDQFSRTQYAINGVPSILGDENPVSALTNIVASVREMGISAMDKWQESIAASLAEDAAIHNGRKMSDNEMRDLVRQLFELAQHSKTPRGKSVMAILPLQDIEKLF